MKYSINLYHEEFIRYLSESDIKRILKSRRYTEEEMALKEQADVKLNVAILSTVADVYRENYFYQRTLERDKEIDEKLRKRKRPAP
jgi:hypothetical protein